MLLGPLRVVADGSTERLNLLSRINLAEQYRFGFGLYIRIMKIGQLDRESLPKLLRYVTEIDNKRDSPRGELS